MQFGSYLRKHNTMPWITGAIVFALSALFAFALERREHRDIERTVSAKARSLAELTVNRLGEHNKDLVRLATLGPGAWESEGVRLIQSGAFRSVALIDSTGRVTASVPDEREAVRLEAVDAQRAEVARSARGTGQVATGAPIVSASGVPIVISAAPTARGEAAVVGESALPALLQQALETSESSGYSLAIYSGSREVYSRATGPRALETRWAQDAPLGDAASGWRLRVWPSASELALHDTHLAEIVLVLGGLVAIGLAGMMTLYQTAERRADALSSAKERLENEIAERERAQHALELSEEQLRQSQKMEAVGRLAGGIAHDFNNLLTAINGYADFLLADIDRGDPRRDDVREIKKAGVRAAALTTQLLAFSRRQIRQPRLIDLNALLTDLEKMLRRVIGEDVDIAWTPTERLGTVKADPSDLEQVLLNLVVNAGDAMPNGGTITVKTGTVAFTAAEPHQRLAPGRYVRLSVRDTGVGMSAETIARIFEPFFTTKGPGKGTGLGLSTVYAIAENLHGAVDVESVVGKGTTFTVYIPQHDEPADTMGSGTLATLAPRGTETVLLVEDEEGVRALASRILERHGYTVLEARNGRDALSIASRHTGPIDLLLTDVVMPEMGGKRLAEALTLRDPSLRVLFISGYTDGDISRRGELNPDTAFLQKPFTARSLLTRVREVLDADALPA